MKALSLLTLSVLTASFALAAPAITEKDLDTETLKGIGTPAQKASLERDVKARAKAEKLRNKEIQEATEHTKRNDAGLRKTIQKRHLNNMLPPCEREPEAPREPGDYTIRF